MPAVWASFSWAGKVGSRRSSAVRPCEEVCEGGEEGREIRGQKKVFAPSLAEYEAHMITHVPFRKWCPFCVRGKAKNQPHASAYKSTREIPMIAYNYM